MGLLLLEAQTAGRSRNPSETERRRDAGPRSAGPSGEGKVSKPNPSLATVRASKARLLHALAFCTKLQRGVFTVGEICFGACGRDTTENAAAEEELEEKVKSKSILRRFCNLIKLKM
ncbi:hypothetical protein NL108_016193 [Boleophthalmus pectinirostris]|nr:hypothetical protein NL108_016193 [Boleophthalmus pectinirostris]